MSKSSDERLTPSLPGQASTKLAITATLKRYYAAEAIPKPLNHLVCSLKRALTTKTPSSSSVVVRRAVVSAVLPAVSAANIPALPLAEEVEDPAAEPPLIAGAALSQPAARPAPAADPASPQRTEAASILSTEDLAAASTSPDQEMMATAMLWTDWIPQCLALMTASTCAPCHSRAAAVP